MISFILLWTAATASFTDCAPDTSLFRIDELSSQPNSIVKTGQPVVFRIVYTVPYGLYVPSITVSMTSSINNIVLPIRSSVYANSSVVAKQYNYTSSFIIPAGIYGRILTVANFYNTSGTQLMCARWNAYVPYPYKKKKGWLTSLFG